MLGLGGLIAHVLGAFALSFWQRHSVRPFSARDALHAAQKIRLLSSFAPTHPGEARLSGHGGEAALASTASAFHPEASWNSARSRGRRCLSSRTRTTPLAVASEILTDSFVSI